MGTRGTKTGDNSISHHNNSRLPPPPLLPVLFKILTMNHANAVHKRFANFRKHIEGSKRFHNRCSSSSSIQGYSCRQSRKSTSQSLASSTEAEVKAMTTSTTTGSSMIAPAISNSTKEKEKPAGIASKVVALSMAMILGNSIYTRKWREEHLMDVPLVNRSDFSFDHDDNEKGSTVGNSTKKRKLKRNLHVLSSIIERNGLMGKTHTVKEELDNIRSWHQKNGYKGGVVLRELSLPLFEPQHPVDNESDDHDDDEDDDENRNSQTIENTTQSTIQPNEMKQRECYYLYYEIKPNGETLHQIFCRGTTISEDVYTCLQSRLVFDDELGIHVHSGFKDHANRLVKDVLPLLGPTYSPRSNVEVSGHSLGGK